MERCVARRSFEKPRVEAPPRLQVIGFNVSPPTNAAETAEPTMSGGSVDMVRSVASSYSELPISPSGQLISYKPAASTSPRSALQQLLLQQSLASTSPTSSNHSLPPLQPSSNQNSKLGLLIQPGISSAAAGNPGLPNDGLLQPSTNSLCPANQKSTSGTSKLQSPPSVHEQRNSGSGFIKYLVQSQLTTSDGSANDQGSDITGIFISKSQLQCAKLSAASGGSQMMINQRYTKPAKAVIGENHEDFCHIKREGYDRNAASAKAHAEVKSPPYWMSSKLDHSKAAKSKKSSWLQTDSIDDDDDYDDFDEDGHPAAAEIRSKRSSSKPIQPIIGYLSGNEKSRKSSSRSEEKSKKSSVFIMFAASSPAPDHHHQGHSEAEHSAFKTKDFLSSCHLCRRPLGPGLDVFMYSGDKAFCSMECRYQQIVMDERKERCPPPVIRSGASPELHHTSVTATATHHRPIMINKPYFINTAAAA